ncbi:MAG: MFS transporter [Promethearchaeota archaeon]
MVRTGMISLFLNIVKDSKTLKLNTILIVNTATIAGYLLISMIFNLNVLKITSIKFWNSFFILGWSFSVLIILFGYFSIDKIKFFDETNSKKDKFVVSTQVKPVRREIIIMGILYLSFILVTSDLMISYPLSSWIFEKFKDIGFRIYSSLYFVFFICSILGLYIANHLCKKYDEKKILCVFTYLYMIILLPITISNFPVFMMLNSALAILSYAIDVVYTSIVTDFSNKGKYGTLKYQLLQTSSSIASLVFIPLGTIYFGIISFEILLIFSSILIGISGLIIIITILVDKEKKLTRREVIIEEEIDLRISKS